MKNVKTLSARYRGHGRPRFSDYDLTPPVRKMNIAIMPQAISVSLILLALAYYSLTH